MTEKDPGWVRVGEHIEARMDELKVSKAELQRLAAVSDKTLTGYLAGRPVRRVDKKRALCDALEWSRDSVDVVYAGGEPTLASERPIANGDLRSLEDRLEAVEEEIVFLKRLALSSAADLVETRVELGLGRRHGDEQFALAADTGDERKPAGKRQNRPSPPPEPEGP